MLARERVPTGVGAAAEAGAGEERPESGVVESARPRPAAPYDARCIARGATGAQPHAVIREATVQVSAAAGRPALDTAARELAYRIATLALAGSWMQEPAELLCPHTHAFARQS